MRIWSLHPNYLDPKGLVALWRETLLAKHVLEGKTKGYRNHPQLTRFRAAQEPVQRINQYLAAVYEEAQQRGYRFDREKIDWNFRAATLDVTSGQLRYEWDHLLSKLQVRDVDRFHELLEIEEMDPHPLFQVIAGEVEVWEVVK